MIFCSKCGEELPDGTGFCTKCGSKIAATQSVQSQQSSEIGISPKSKVAAAVLAFFLGWFGVHDFYLGNILLGIVKVVISIVGAFFTAGILDLILEVWAIVDIVIILCGKRKDGKGLLVTK